MHCQDVSSFGNAPVKMCRLWAGGLVCVHVCVFPFYFCPKCFVVLSQVIFEMIYTYKDNTVTLELNIRSHVCAIDAQCIVHI